MAESSEQHQGQPTGDWHTVSQKSVPPVSWDATNKSFVVTLKGVELRKLNDPNTIGVQIQFRPPILYDVRIRKKGSDKWGVGFIVPMSSISFSGYEPDTDYEVQIIQVDASGRQISDAPPVVESFRSIGVGAPSSVVAWSPPRQDTWQLRFTPPSIHCDNTETKVDSWYYRLQNFKQHEDRIDELRVYCEEDGVSLNAKSENDFRDFIISIPFDCSSKFDIVATDSGNLRAVLDDEDKHIGVQFFGDEDCEYVVWSSKIRPDAGRDTLSDMVNRIQGLL